MNLLYLLRINKTGGQSHPPNFPFTLSPSREGFYYLHIGRPFIGPFIGHLQGPTSQPFTGLFHLFNYLPIGRLFTGTHRPTMYRAFFIYLSFSRLVNDEAAGFLPHH